MSAIGDELVTLEQFKRVVSGGGGKKYKITKSQYLAATVEQAAALDGEKLTVYSDDGEEQSTGAASHRHIIGGEGTD